MHTPLSNLLATFLGLTLMQCSSEPSKTSTIKEPASAVDSAAKDPSVGSWQVEPDSANKTQGYEVGTLNPDSNAPYQDVKLMNVERQIASYTALIPIQETPSGKISLQVELNPQKHSIKKLTLLYARQNQWHTIKQIGNGVGHYNTTKQRYYVNVAYQEVLELPDKLQSSSDLREVNCWVSTQTNTAGIQHIEPVKL
ncbi:hypothetical protein [Hymenobacter sp. GOD-10R]|uniref:hypothetical protein n=1 Tax=Hymenobacter sp. GOD-10R TaxID=3093922 RepID=UPI002D794E5F|nr:hypothetical protein [Hymenobacter sp. GOD-10R]WRQ30987.1 hypothetical protein SD425_12025 [Hymenobacter sp. GOD-10R]